MLEPKSALKSSHKNTKRNEDQKTFLKAIFDIGKRNKEEKKSAYETRELMQKKGTQEGYQMLRSDIMIANNHGYPSFRFIDVLDISQIKMHFSTMK